MCKHASLVRPKVFVQAMSRKRKKNAPPITGWVCCTTGKITDEQHFSAKYPIGYNYSDGYLSCLICGIIFTDASDDSLREIIDCLEDLGLPLLEQRKDEPERKQEVPKSVALSRQDSTSSTYSAAPGDAFYFNPPTKDFLTVHISKLIFVEKVTKKVKNMHGAHGHTHGPGQFKRGQGISLSIWENMDTNARKAAVKAGARSPAMVAQRRLEGLLDSQGYVQGLACSIFQALVQRFFRDNEELAPLAGIVCTYLFTEKLKSLRSFAEECLLVSAGVQETLIES